MVNSMQFAAKSSNNLQFAKQRNLKIKLLFPVKLLRLTALPAICISVDFQWHTECKINFMLLKRVAALRLPLMPLIV
jgi:hypothetical protein